MKVLARPSSFPRLYNVLTSHGGWDGQTKGHRKIMRCEDAPCCGCCGYQVQMAEAQYWAERDYYAEPDWDDED